MAIRILENTAQEWKDHFDTQTMTYSRIYNTPESTGKELDYCQGKSSIELWGGFDQAFLGTCGIVSCVNILRLAGRTETTEAEVLDYAFHNDLCCVDYDPCMCGATSATQRMRILKHFGVDSCKVPIPDKAAAIEHIAQYVSDGRGVIISVFNRVLWGKIPEALDHREQRHAVTVTSVRKDLSGSIAGFYICDSGTLEEDYARYCDVDLIMRSLSGVSMNVTTNIIR